MKVEKIGDKNGEDNGEETFFRNIRDLFYETWIPEVKLISNI